MRTPLQRDFTMTRLKSSSESYRFQDNIDLTNEITNILLKPAFVNIKNLKNTF